MPIRPNDSRLLPLRSGSWVAGTHVATSLVGNAVVLAIASCGLRMVAEDATGFRAFLAVTCIYFLSALAGAEHSCQYLRQAAVANSPLQLVARCTFGYTAIVLTLAAWVAARVYRSDGLLGVVQVTALAAVTIGGFWLQTRWGFRRWDKHQRQTRGFEGAIPGKSPPPSDSVE